MATRDNYFQALNQLLPLGPAWPRDLDPASSAQSCLSWLAAELERADQDVDALFDEADPRTADTMLSTWLSEWGLPDACMRRFDQTDFPRDQLRTMLAAQIGTWGLTSSQAIFYIAKLYGKTASIENVDPFTVASTVDKRLYDSSRRAYVLIVSISDGQRAEFFDVTWTADQPLGRWGDDLFECSVKAIIPAHLTPIFSYPDSVKGETA